MFKINLKTIIRNLSKTPTLTAIKVFGLSIGIAYVLSCPLAYLVINNCLNSFAYHTTIEWLAFGVTEFISP